MGTNVANINVAEIEAQVNQMSEEDIRKQLIEAKVRQKVATKKYYNPESAKKQRQKRAETLKLLADRAKQLGIYDQILEEAGKQADAKLASEEAETEQVEA